MSSNIAPFNRMEEEKIREFWVKENTKVKVREKSSKSKQKFYFMDGPPYATGHIHMGTGLNKIMKDCAIRSQRMQDKKIFDRPGFDTHGVPIESKVEKKLGFKTKKDIEEYGVEKFINECKSFATQFVDTMAKEFDNLGDWMPYEDPYLTLSNEYIEAIWFAFKKADERDLLYLGKYPVHVCPHCATAVAFNEIVYTKLTDQSIFVKLKVEDPKMENTYLVVWTTTPWTLPANTGVMVHPSFEYDFAKLSNGETWIVAKEKLQGLMDKIEAGFIVEKTVKGKELEGYKYEPLFDFASSEDKAKAYRVIMSDRYVTLDVGSGLVHTAPGHGKEDFEAGTKAGLPALSPVNIDGTFTSAAGKYVGKQARETNKEIIRDLEERNLLPYKDQYTHDYPLCWRCESPLLMISLPQWFLRVSNIREKMRKDNENVNWVPSWMKDRMNNWIDNLSDWPVSRARYWGAPLPIWTCECGERKVLGSMKELMKEANLTKEIELHKPYIDNVKLKCKCGKEMSRVSEVLDVWFDSGVSSWGNLKYPGKEEDFKEFWPADLNIEMTEQVRGWWNSQSILSEICFDSLPYKAVSVHGMVLDLGHQKMSKSKGNAVTPNEMIEQYNRDYLRCYLLQQSRGTDFSFDANGPKDFNGFFNTLTNSLNYSKMYMNIDLGVKVSDCPKDLLAEDKWFLSKSAELYEKCLSAYNDYEFFKALGAIQEFVDKVFSRGYLQLVRQRIGSDSQKQIDYSLSVSIASLLRLFAPIAPHASEYYYQQFGGKGSIHEHNFLDISNLREKDLEEEYSFVELVAQNALALRTEQKLRLRWQLEEMVLDSEKKVNNFSEALARMCNVKKINFAKTPVDSNDYVVKEISGVKIALKISASAELKEDWELSELLRLLQDGRKKAGLKPGQKVIVECSCSDLNFLEKNKSKIEEKTTTEIKVVSGKSMEKLVDIEFGFEILK